jgi:activator of HSP90 ATPase
LAITLGKDCSVSVGGNIVSARSVTLTESARTIEVNQFASRVSAVYSTGYDASVSVEFNDSADASALFTALQNGDVISVTGGAGGWGFDAVVTGLSETASIDGVATFTVEARMTSSGLR